MKLELKHLAPYLPYGLYVEWVDHGHKDCKKIIGASEGSVTFNVEGSEEFEEEVIEHTILFYDKIKPLLRPLSQLTEEIEHNGERFVPSFELEDLIPFIDFEPSIKSIQENKDWINDLPYGFIQQLLEWHFDVFGLIENGLAIEKK